MLVRCVGVSLATMIASIAVVSAATDLRLIEAVKTHNAEAVQALIKQKVDVNARQNDGATALHWAVHFTDTNAIELLLRSGAKPDLADDTGVTPLYLACLNRQGALVERLLQSRANPNAALVSGEFLALSRRNTSEWE